MTKYSFLESFTFPKSGVTVKNRVVIPPMTECMALCDGTVSDDELSYYSKHTGGVGLFISAVANVNELGKGFEGELSIADDKFIPGLKKLAHAMKKDGTKAVIQIFSAGRMSNHLVLKGRQPVSASAVAALRPDSELPRALTDEEIRQTIQDFGQATRRAIEAGFDGVEIHGANTYLIQQFFSSHSNHRNDHWGGNLEKRMNFPLAVIHECQAVVQQYASKDFILGYRISPEETEKTSATVDDILNFLTSKNPSEELDKPGITFEETLKFVDVLKDLPLDYLHVSMSDVWRKSLNDPNIQTALNVTIKEHLQGKLPMIVVGDIQTPQEADRAVNQGFELVALGRQSIREPQWVQKVESNNEEAIRYAISPADLDELGIKQPFLDILLWLCGAEGIPLKDAQSLSEQRNQINQSIDNLLSGGE